jgi:hypothetical protein
MVACLVSHTSCHLLVPEVLLLAAAHLLQLSLLMQPMSV